MGATLGSYEIARSGMYVSERSLTVTGHNVSNATTAGYVRQQAIISTSRYTTEYGKFQVGQGAQIEQTRQIRNTFLDAIYRREATSLGYWKSRSSSLSDMEEILGDPPMEGVDGDLNITGLQNVMNQFWDSWQELSKDPSSLTVRSLVRQRAVTLVDQINHMGKQLDNLQYHLNDEIKTRVTEVNDLTKQIADLNTQICYNEVTGDNANDLRDQRNLLIDRLSELTNIETQEMSGGWVYVTLSGNVLVNRGVSTDIYLDNSDTFGPFHTPKLSGTNEVINFKSGILKGLFESRGEVFYCEGLDSASAVNPSSVDGLSVSDLKKLVNTLVLNLANTLNTYHKEGMDLKDDAGKDFFVPTNADMKMGIGNIKINSLIETDVNRIVAGKTDANGDNEIARKIANLRSNEIIGANGQEMSTDEYYNNIILKLGSVGQEAVSNTKSQEILVSSADNSRKAITDVSMDEEMSNMMKFQFAYGAASKVLNVIDEMVDTIVSRMGLVGR